ncbi:MAG: hypothetical protein AB7Q04_13010 [Steroidobacteraceae bacterium]
MTDKEPEPPFRVGNYNGKPAIIHRGPILTTCHDEKLLKNIVAALNKRYAKEAKP